MPQSSLQAELAEIIATQPKLGRWLQPPATAAGRPTPRVVRPGFFLVPIPIPERPGSILVSRLPGTGRASARSDVSALRELGVDKVVCLIPEAQLVAERRPHDYLTCVRQLYGEGFRLLPVENHQVPRDDDDFEQAVIAADAALTSGDCVLVHCLGGCGRTGMFVCSVMIHGGTPSEEALAHFVQCRGCGPETLEQLAYVVRYERRLRCGNGPDSPWQGARLHLARGSDGYPRTLARGGLHQIAVGYLVAPSHRRRRVAVKIFRQPVDNETAKFMQHRIDALVRAGVRLPKMGMLQDEHGRWVQVAQLYGSLRQGSKLCQPGTFYQHLELSDVLFAADQLARVTHARYMPSIDLFLVFKDNGRIIPADLDLITPSENPAQRAAELLKRLVQITPDGEHRELALQAALSVAGPEVVPAIRSLLYSDNPYRRLWRHHP